MSASDERAFDKRDVRKDAVDAMRDGAGRHRKWSAGAGIGPVQAAYYTECARLYGAAAAWLERHGDETDAGALALVRDIAAADVFRADSEFGRRIADVLAKAGG